MSIADCYQAGKDALAAGGLSYCRCLAAKARRCPKGRNTEIFANVNCVKLGVPKPPEAPDWPDRDTFDF